MAAAVALAAATGAQGAAVRHLKPVQVVEGEAATVAAQGAESARSTGPSVVDAALHEGELVVSGVGIGAADVQLLDARGVFADLRVTVVPSYWDVLKRVFVDTPEVSIELAGGKVVLMGATASTETLKLITDAKQLDPERIISQVSYSPDSLKTIVEDFLRSSDITNLAVNVVGRQVCLSGRVYDGGFAKSVQERIMKHLQDFPGVSVNVEDIKMYRQKILLNIQFVEWNDTRARNLGIKGPDVLTAAAEFAYGLDFNGADGGSSSSSRTGNSGNTHTATTGFSMQSQGGQGGQGGGGGGTPVKTPIDALNDTITRGLTGEWTDKGDGSRSVSWHGGLNAGIQKMEVKLNLLKNNGVAKKMYGTKLATQSGEEVKFQNGGTMHMRVQGVGAGSSGDLKKVDYGYQITATPYIVDPETLNLEFNLDYSNIAQFDPGTGNLNINRYLTKSRYVMSPGETIVLSGFDSKTDQQTKDGMPFLSRIWGLQWLLGNTQSDNAERQMILVVTVDWMVEDSEGAKQLVEDWKKRPVEVEMP